MPNPIAVQGASVVITGAARGIGYATARSFLAAGARVFIGDLDGDLAKTAAAELGSRARNSRTTARTHARRHTRTREGR